MSATMESGLSEWVIQRACEKLIVQYAQFIDSGQAARVADLFTADGIWEAYNNRRVGQAVIREAFHWRERYSTRFSRHVCTNISIDVLGAKEATGHTYFTLFREEGGGRSEFVPFTGPKMVGDYFDRFVLTEAGWRFAHRRVVVAFKIPGLPVLGERPASDAAPHEAAGDEDERSED